MYGSAYVEGFIASDLVCTFENANSCAKMEWVSMTYGKGLDGIDGIAGMSTGLSQWSEGDLLVQKLYEANVISKPQFGFYLAGTEEQSYLDIGQFQNSSMRNPEELVWIDVENESFWWEATISGIRFTSADKSTTDEYSIMSGSTALTDTGSSCSYIPF